MELKELTGGFDQFPNVFRFHVDRIAGEYNRCWGNTHTHTHLNFQFRLCWIAVLIIQISAWPPAGRLPVDLPVTRIMNLPGPSSDDEANTKT